MCIANNKKTKELVDNGVWSVFVGRVSSLHMMIAGTAVAIYLIYLRCSAHYCIVWNGMAWHGTACQWIGIDVSLQSTAPQCARYQNKSRSNFTKNKQTNTTHSCTDRCKPSYHWSSHFMLSFCTLLLLLLWFRYFYFVHFMDIWYGIEGIIRSLVKLLCADVWLA